MFKIKSDKVLYSINCVELTLENDDKLTCTFKELEKVYHGEDMQFESYNGATYEPVYEDIKYSDEQPDLLGFNKI